MISKICRDLKGKALHLMRKNYLQIIPHKYFQNVRRFEIGQKITTGH